MRTRKPFSIRFVRRMASAIHYADREGDLIFIFKLSRGKRDIAIHRFPLRDGAVIVPTSDTDRARIGAALDRVSHYLQAKRFSVSVADPLPEI